MKFTTREVGMAFIIIGLCVALAMSRKGMSDRDLTRVASKLSEEKFFGDLARHKISVPHVLEVDLKTGEGKPWRAVSERTTLFGERSFGHYVELKDGEWKECKPDGDPILDAVSFRGFFIDRVCATKSQLFLYVRRPTNP